MMATLSQHKQHFLNSFCQEKETEVENETSAAENFQRQINGGEFIQFVKKIS